MVVQCHKLKPLVVKNGPFGIDIAIAIGIESNAMAVFIDFDSDPDSDRDGYAQYGNFLS